jgi:hypothetical protein
VIGVTNQDIVACKEIWRFFRQYKLDQLSATDSPASMAENWSAYPNPALDHLILESKNAAAVKQVQVWDALGRLQTSLKPGNENRIELNTAAWAQGIYWIVVEASGRVERIKVVKT